MSFGDKSMVELMYQNFTKVICYVGNVLLQNEAIQWVVMTQLNCHK